MEIFGEIPIFLKKKTGEKILGSLHEDLRRFYCCRRNEIALKVLPSSEMVSSCMGTRHNAFIVRHVILKRCVKILTI